MQRGHASGGGGRDDRQSDLWSAVLGRRACRQTVGILALFLLAADDFQSVSRRRIFSVLRHRQHWRLGGGGGGMAATLGLAGGPGCAGDRCLFLYLCASVLARTASVLREGCEDPCAARTPAHGHVLSHCRGSRLPCRRTESGGTAVDSDLSCSSVIWWQLRAGVDVEPALWPAHPQQRIPDARNRTQPGMDYRRRGPGNRVHRGTGTRRKVSFALASDGTPQLVSSE